MSNENKSINKTNDELNENIEIMLGQIIKLIAPDNMELNEKTFYIKYLDDNKIRLFDPYAKILKVLNLESGTFTDESIIGIEILYNPEHKGYARQNGLFPGTGITIEFGGNIPEIINGEITNLEEDMIELKVINVDTKIYIDFKYQGIPEELEIIEIKPFDLDLVATEKKQVTQIEKDEGDDDLFDDDYLDEDDDELLFNYDEELKIEENLVILDEALDVIDNIEDIDIDIEIAARNENKRFSLNKQIDSMLDDLLARIPSNERSKQKIYEINKNIIRFKELRYLFSNYKEDGNIENPKYKHLKEDYKPLLESLKKLDKKFSWLLPIIEVKKKIYDIDMLETTNDDYIIDRSDNFVKNYIETFELYRDNVTNVDEKYIYLEQNINDLQKNYVYNNDTTNIINIIDVFKDIECFVENYDNISSSAYKNEGIINTYNYKLKLLGGKNILEIDPITKLTSYKKIIEPEKLYFKGFVVMPDEYQNYNKTILKETTIYEKANINSTFKFHKIPDNYEYENIIIDDDFSKINLETNNINPFKITFNNYMNYEDMDNKDVYDNFLNAIIPSINDIIINKFKQIESMNVYEFINKLEVFNIYHGDINSQHHEIISNIIKKKIISMKKTLASREKEYLNINASNRNELKLLERILTNDDIPLINDIIKNYNIIDKLSNSEQLNKMIIEDGGKNFTILISKILLPLSQDMNYEQRIEEEMQKVDNMEENNEGIGECDQFVIAKKYNNIEDLKRDNGNQELLYDREYDNTRYDIMEEFETDRDILKPEALEQKVMMHLINVVGVEDKQAKRDAISMISGKKLVVKNEYAILDLGDYEYRYYERKNDNWVLNEDFNDKMPDDAAFCNLKQKCLTIKDKCSPVDKHHITIEKNILNQIATHFSEELNTLQNRKKTKLTSLYDKTSRELAQIINFNNKQKSKKDKLMLDIANTLEDYQFKLSPYFELRDEILSQNDIIKKNSDILVFVDKYCRHFEETNKNENMYWYYCKETDIPLLPTFFYELAIALENNQYEETLERIVKNRGKLSDDADKMVDKYSGYTIKIIDFDTNEGYDKNGYKIVSREVIEENEQDLLTTILENRDNTKTSLSNLLENIFKSMSKNVGINISNELDYMVSSCINLIEMNIKSKAEYNNMQIRSKKRNSKNMISYDKYHDKIFVLCLVSVLVVVLQSRIPRIKSSKTIPGCIVSFSGFPLEQEKNKKNVINYVVCSIVKYKNNTRPWNNGLPRISGRNNTKDVQKLESYYNSVVNFLKTKVLILPEMEGKLAKKREWLRTHAETKENSIDTVFSLKRWTTFLPPLYKVTSIKEKTISSSLQNLTKMLESTIRKGSNKQNDLINMCYGMQQFLSVKILDLINKVVERKEKLFITNAGIPYLENACCNDDSDNVFDYFVKNESGTKIDRYNENVSVARKVINRVKELSYSATLFTDTNTKQPHSKTNNILTEETIYRAFIKYCKYNTGLELDDELKSICEKNTANFKKFDSIEDKIEVLKNENGTLYNSSMMMNLISIIHKRNLINFNFNRDVITNDILFKKMLESIKLNKEGMYNVDLFEQISIFFNKNGEKTYKNNKKLEGKISSKQEEVSDFINLLENKNIDYKEKLNNFLNQNNISRSTIKKINSFIDKIEKFNIKNENIYMLQQDSINSYIGEYLKINIGNISKIIPEIIINEVDYKNKYIPKHWKLGSMFHENDVKKIIKVEYKNFEKFYGNKLFSNILNNVTNKTLDLSILAETIPFITTRIETSMISTKVYIKLLKFILLHIIAIHIDITNIIDKNGNVEIKETVVELSEIDQAMREANIQTLKERMSQYLVSLFGYLMKSKKTINLNREKIKKNVLKSKVKEKNIITDRLRNMTVEQRQIENLKKNHRLGEWNVGQTRAIFEYNENQYDKERQQMEDRHLLEIKLGLTDDVTMEQRDIYMLDHLEQNAISRRIEKDELGFDLRDEGERDEEEYW